jgi:hypothetical protein
LPTAAPVATANRSVSRRLISGGDGTRDAVTLPR